MDLFREFLDLPNAGSATEFTAVSLSSHRKDFLAKSSDGAPVFLLHDSSTLKYTPSIQFRYLLAQFHSTCSVQTTAGDIQDQFAVVACDAATPELHELFIRCFGAAIEQLPTSSGTKELESCIQRLLDLFRSMAHPGGREVSGLWAELFVIVKSSNIPTALSAWHADQFDRFDFSWEMGRLEVKASTHEVRVHEFALEQLSVPIDGDGYVASLVLQPLTGGSGVIDLASRIEDAVTHEPQLRQKLWSNIAKALGSDFSEKLDRRFDASFAERNLKVYSMGDVPSIEHPSDPRISGIRYKVNLSTIESTLTGSPLSSLSSIFSVKRPKTKDA